MALHTIRHARNLGSADNGRDWSPNIWGDCPAQAIKEGSVPGVWFEDDFVSFPKTAATTEGNWGQYAQFSSTGTTLTAGTGQGGELVIASDDDNDAGSIRTLSTPFKIIRAGGTGELWFEARLKKSTVADTKLEFFVGLMQDVAMTAIIPITTTAATLADYNMVGFYGTESDGDAISTTYKADGVTAVTVGTGEAVPAADTYIKLGMKYEPYGLLGNYYLSFYANNLKLASSKQIPSAAGTDFPNDVSLGLVLATRNAAGSSPGTLTIDKWRCFQLIGE